MCYIIFGTISYSQERMTVNHDATGSSPVTGASEKPLTIRFKGFFLLFENAQSTVYGIENSCVKWVSSG